MEERNSHPTEPELLDLLIVGAGPAGVACALQARRDGLRSLLLDDAPIGGLLPAARRLDNLPGLPGVPGSELARRLRTQLVEAQVPYESQRVTGLMRTGEHFVASTKAGRVIRARLVCLATGTKARPWTAFDLPAGVHRDLRSLPADLVGRNTVVVGGGEAALDTALSLADRGAAVQLWLRGARFKACPPLLREAAARSLRLCTKRQLLGVEGRVGAWRLIDQKGISHSAHELALCIGREADDALLRELPAGCPGLFTAGDLIRGRERYAASAFGDGQRAAIEAARHLNEES